jgi:arsenate reductase
LVVTVCDNAREACPVFPGDELIHHSFKDPSAIHSSEDEVLSQVREIRDEIKKWITLFFK